MMRAPLPLMCCAMALTMLLGACGTDNESAVRLSIIDGPADRNVDARRLGPLAVRLRDATSQGLVRFDAAGNIVPGLAERWIVTDYGRSFIFRLRDAQWDDGDKVTSQQVAEALRRRIRIEQGQRMSADLDRIRDVRAMTDKVIEIRLLSPEPDFLQVIAQPELGIRRSGRGTGPLDEERAKGWTTLTVPVMDGAAPTPRTIERPLFVRGEDAAHGIARFASGASDAVLGGRFEHLPYLASADVNANTIIFDGVAGLFGLAVVEDQGFLSQASNREAIAMAIDRSALMTGLNLGQWETGTRYVRAGIDGYDAIAANRWEGRAIADLREIARGRVSDWQARNGPAAPLRIALADGPGSRVLFARLKADLASIGLRARLVGVSQNADLRLIDRVAAYDEPIWYLNQLSCAMQRLCDREGDDLLARARRAVDPEVRLSRLVEAETAMTAANYYIPLGTPVRWSLVRSGLTGIISNPTAWHPLPDIAIIPR
ncbi:MAG: ABC transporter substrate-binding protein [Blastomonas sp.]